MLWTIHTFYSVLPGPNSLLQVLNPELVECAWHEEDLNLRR